MVILEQHIIIENSEGKFINNKQHFNQHMCTGMYVYFSFSAIKMKAAMPDN